ncbi:hypothetical protein FRB90_005458, partial [Tulasnella sp. 427]
TTWGKYGTITEADIFTKEQEFHAWLLEEKMVNPETLSKAQLKKHFSSYMEDYNTATLPHEKYYALESFEQRMAAVRAGETLPPDDFGYDAKADMDAHKARTTRKSRADESETYLSKDQLMELRKVQNERAQVGKMKLLGLDVKQNFGVRMDGNAFE